jgi:non-specific serine/threonine protein kinase
MSYRRARTTNPPSPPGQALAAGTVSSLCAETEASSPLLQRLGKPNNLPRQLTSFVGREREIAEVARLLDSAALVTLTGAGGAGKTRLAIQVAADLLDVYADGVWLAELAALSDGSLVAQAIAQAVGVQEETRRPLVESLASTIGTREVLLLLDNCEHLLAACAALVDRLLRACPRLRILATSREPLGIAGETVFRVPSLPLPDVERLPPVEEQVRYEAVRLFLDRALAVQPGFAVTDHNAPALAQVCHRLDGIPLAIELAAARVSALTVEQIAARLDQRFRLLIGGSRTAMPRQQTLRATVDWSYELLAERERLLLQRLAVFAGGWTLEAAETVCSGGGIEEQQVLETLSALVDKSLVQAEAQGEAVRYRLLETVRQYAREMLQQSGEEAVVCARHLSWLLALAERAATEARGLQQATWLDRFEVEHDNFRTALGWSTSAGDTEAGLRLTTMLLGLWSLRGYSGEGRARLADLLSRAPERTRARAGALTSAGYLAVRQGDYTVALPLLAESLVLWREFGDEPGIARALHVLGEALLGLGEHGQAKMLLEESLGLYRELGDTWTVSGVTSTLPRVLCCLADIGYAQADYIRASARYEEGLAVAREYGHVHDVGYALRGLGHLARVQGDYGRATGLLKESLGILAQLKDRRCTPLCVEGLACVASELGQVERAARLFGAAEALREAIGVTLLPAERADHDRAAASARAVAAEATFAAAWAEGRTMTLEQAAEYAVATAEPVAATPPEAPPRGSPAAILTPREREVSALIAGGLTNSQIAERLVLSVRTVERHIENIYGKIGAHGKAARAAVTVFALQHHLADVEESAVAAPRRDSGESYA